jgi:glycosyltransferase involved in cell wall biosynthesis
MKIWLITVGEPLPIDGQGDRLLRTGILADRMVDEGHEVTWWTSGFDHVRKRHRSPKQGRISLRPRYQIHLLESLGYPRNISLARLRDQGYVARDFCRAAAEATCPDLILCSWPTLDLCVQAVEYGRQHDIPVLLDIRDLWPDALVDLAPSWARPVLRLAARSMYQQAAHAARQATAITGITDSCIDWARQMTRTPRTLADQAFPLAYQERTPTTAEQAAALEFWSRQGVRNDGVFTACYFGTFGQNKVEIATVIAAARLLAKRQVPIRFVLCGSTSELPASHQLAVELPSVILPGWVNAAQIWTLMRLASVGLAPYRSIADFKRSIPNKPIEYMSAGLPVVSSLEGVLQELLDRYQAGVTYANDCPEQLAEVLRRLNAEPSLLAAWASNAKALYHERFVAENVYEKMLAYLTDFAKPVQQKLVA